MSRKREEIKREMTDNFLDNEIVRERYQLVEGKNFDEQFSKMSIENLLFDVVAFAVWVLEQLFWKHRDEVEQMIYELKPHTQRWYRSKALNFQYGFELLPETDRFNNKNHTIEEINKSKIVKYAAVTESKEKSTLVLKVATEVDNELRPLGIDKLTSFKAYMDEIKDAGVNVSVISYEPDILNLEIRIYKDPLILDNKGQSILNAKSPVNEALEEFLKELPFNGELILQDLANKLEKAEGVKIVQIDSAKSKWIDPETNGYGDVFKEIDVKVSPESGYFKLEKRNLDLIQYLDYKTVNDES